MRIALVLIVVLGLLFKLSEAYPSEEFMERELALEYLGNDEEADDAALLNNLKRSLMYTGREQRREAKVNYESKCERKMLNKMLKKPRWCPELTE